MTKKGGIGIVIEKKGYKYGLTKKANTNTNTNIQTGIHKYEYKYKYLDWLLQIWIKIQIFITHCNVDAIDCVAGGQVGVRAPGMWDT